MPLALPFLALLLLIPVLAACGRGKPDLLNAEERRLGFEALFDGRSLDAWRHSGNWVVQDGAMYRERRGGDITYTARPVPDDFEVRFEWKVDKGTNSGVYYRPGQYEYQILDNANSSYGSSPRESAASLFFCMAPSHDATRPYGEWNEGRIVAKGTVIQHWLNGDKVIDFDYTDPRWAREVEMFRIRGLRPPHGGDLSARGAFLRLQDHGQDVWFRNIRWRAIPQEEVLERSEVEPMPIPPAAQRREQARITQILTGRIAELAEEQAGLEEMLKRWKGAGDEN